MLAIRIETLAAAPLVEAEVRLADGTRIGVRSLRPADRDAYVRSFYGLSPRARYERFAGPKKRLSNPEIARFLDVGHDGHEALIAVDPRSGCLIGVARFAAGVGTPAPAEVAVVIGDEWQGRGVAGALFAYLLPLAGLVGYRRLTASTLADNQAVAALLRRNAFRPVSRSLGIVEWEAEAP